MRIRSQMNSSRFVISIIAIAFVGVFLFLCVPQAHAARAYGQLSSLYESGNDPSEIDSGVAYGAYQMSVGNTYLFAQWLKTQSSATTVSYGTKLVAAYTKDGKKCGSNFNTAWKAIAKAAPTSFFNLQYTFVKKVYYSVAVTLWQSAESGFKVSNYSYALRNVIFSTAVQHGPTGSASIFAKAMTTLGGYKTSYSEGKIIRAIYAERSRVTTTAPHSNSIKIASVSTGVSNLYASFNLKSLLVGKYLSHFSLNASNVQVGVYIRLAINEPSAALKLLVKYTGAFTGIPHTGGVTTYSSITDKSYVKKVSAAYYTATGIKIASATSKTVTQSYTMSGSSWKSPCGSSYTIHSTGYYATNASKVTLRSSTSVTSTAKATLAKNAVVKVTKAKMGSDGFWWAKTTVSSTSGYIRMTYLSHLGTASSIHKYVKGVCIYCGATKAQIARNTAGTYKLAAAASSYSAAYTQSKKKTAFAKSTKVTVTKVVKNRFHDWWGKLSNGTYIKMTLLK